MSLLIAVIAVVILATVAGCGGGQEQELATGVVKSFEQEDRRLRLKPQEEAQVFKYNAEDIEVTLGSELGRPEDVEEGQRATISYVVGDDRQLARSIELERQ